MKRLVLFLGLVIVGVQLCGQADIALRPLPDYNFTNFERNRLVFPSGDSLAMERFFSKLDVVVNQGKGNVSILHIGGSHVQFGAFTQQFRDNLLNIGDHLMGGPYFVFPFTAGGTNNPSHYTVHATGEWQYCRNAVERETDKRMGLAGAALTTTDSTATIQIITHERYPSEMPPEYNFNKVTLIGFSETNNVVPALSYQGDTLHGSFNEELSTYTFVLPNYTDSICILFDSVPGKFTLTGVLLESHRPGISVHGVGVNGAKVPSYLRCEDFERDLQHIRPDLVIFGIGINDAADKDFDAETFKQNYRDLIGIVQAVNPDCALLFITNNDSYKRRRVKRKTIYEVNTNGKLVEETFMELGAEYHAAVWDQFDIMGGLRSMRKWEKEGLARRDKVHFTREGYTLMGDLLYNALMERYLEHINANKEN